MADYKLVDIEQLEAGLTATAEAIREHTGKEDLMKLEEMPEEIEGVFEAGKKSEYDAFWDVIQNYGNRINYERAFGLWDSEYIRPKYKVIPTDLTCNAVFTTNRKLKKIEKKYFDFSKVEGCNAEYFCNACSNLLEFEDVNFLPKRYGYTWRYCGKLETIEVIHIQETTEFGSPFAGCVNLKNIVIDGVIAKNGFNVGESTKLTKPSITSIINALSTSTSGLTVTLSLTAVNNAFETTEGAADGSTSEEWLALAATKSNWTISLV